jgi:hypothetical protein
MGSSIISEISDVSNLFEDYFKNFFCSSITLDRGYKSTILGFSLFIIESSNITVNGVLSSKKFPAGKVKFYW